MDKENVIYIYIYIYIYTYTHTYIQWDIIQPYYRAKFGHLQRVDGPRDCHTERSMSDRKTNIIY